MRCPDTASLVESDGRQCKCDCQDWTNGLDSIECSQRTDSRLYYSTRSDIQRRSQSSSDCIVAYVCNSGSCVLKTSSRKTHQHQWQALAKNHLRKMTWHLCIRAISARSHSDHCGSNYRVRITLRVRITFQTCAQISCQFVTRT